MADDLLEAVRDLAARGEYDNALALCDEARAGGPSPTHPRVFTCRAFVHRRMKAYDLAVADASEGLALHPRDPGLLFDRAVSQIEDQSFEAAYADLERVLDAERAKGDDLLTETANLLLAICSLRLARFRETIDHAEPLDSMTRFWILGRLHTRDQVLAEAKDAHSKRT